jgi:hypothetical protein
MSEVKQQIKILRDGSGNPIRMIKITIDKTGKIWYNGGTPKERE